MARKALVIGLDGVPPALLFEQWSGQLPNIRRLMQNGTYARLRSTDPPITCPAWMSMATGKNPGRLGFYGFKNRADYTYHSYRLVSSEMIEEDPVWDILGRAEKRCLVLGVPPTYPPRPLNGWLVSCFLTPGGKSPGTYPIELGAEIKKAVGEYLPDIQNFRTADKTSLLKQIYRMTEKRFALARYLLGNKEWDFGLLVEMGPDRIHHGFWSFCEPAHRRYRPGNPYENAIRDYYLYLDREIGELLKTIPEDTLVLVVSDHGARRMEGGIALNQWLMDNSYLALAEKPAGPLPLARARVDWKRTLAWGEGGYCGRVFLNVKGREPEGAVEPSAYQQLRNEIKKKLEALPDEQGRCLSNRVLTPEEAYGHWKNIAPDLLVYFGDLSWRAVGSVGHPSWYVSENDTGSDDANHDHEGILIMSGKRARGQIEGRHLMDVAPTVLNFFGIPVPADMEGKIIE